MRGEGLSRERWRNRVEFKAGVLVPWATPGLPEGMVEQGVMSALTLAGAAKVGKSLGVC